MRKIIVTIGFSLGISLCLATAPTKNSVKPGPISFKIPFYTGSILPVPQKADYYDEFIDLSETGLALGKNVKPADPELKILTDRIAVMGGKSSVLTREFRVFKTIISLGENDYSKALKVPEQKEGYIIKNLKKNNQHIVALKGTDKKGLLWAIVSLNQLMTSKNGKPVLRKADIIDYPVYHHRGIIAGSVVKRPALQWAYYAVAFKFNVLQFYSQTICDHKKLYPNWKVVKRANYDPAFWRNPPPAAWLKAVKELGDYLTPLGIDWYVGLSTVRGRPEDKIDSKSEKDFNAVMKIVGPIAAAGGGVHFHYDDSRFPINEADKKNFGSAREADMFFFNKIYKTVKQKYPGFKMTICPPFYWGPQYPPVAYGEDRDQYLRAIGKRLPEEIGIYWTGRAVWGGKVKKSEVEWITERIKRKPWFWQNGTGMPHMYGYHYYTDPVDVWPDWHYNGFFNDVYFTWPCNLSRDSVLLLTMVDYMWNPKTYDRKKIIEEAAKKLTGTESCVPMTELNKALSKLDKYECKFSLGAVRNMKQIEKDTVAVVKAYEKCLSHHPDAIKKWTSLENIVNRQQRFLKTLKAKSKGKDMAFFTKNTENLKKNAEKEMHYNPKTDVFLSPYDFNGGSPAQIYGFECEKRLATWIYGAGTDINTLGGGFRVIVPPTKKSYNLIISGQDDDREKKCRIKILVNNNTVFEGENPFVRFGWSRHTFPVKGLFLKEGGNSIQIKNIEDCNRRKGPPFFMLNYLVLKNVK